MTITISNTLYIHRKGRNMIRHRRISSTTHDWTHQKYNPRKYLLKKGILAISMAVFVLSHFAPTPADAAPAIKAAVVSSRNDIGKGDYLDIDPVRYWRSNVTVDTGVLTGEKKAVSSHVPALVEYCVDFPEGGSWELEARFSTAQPGPVYLTLDGKRIATLFNEVSGSPEKWTRLAQLDLRPGKHHLRFTAQYVETPFPRIEGLRLKFMGGAVPPPAPEPEVVDYREKLPEDWYKTISRKIHGDFHTGGFIKGIGKSFDPDEYARTLEENGINSIAIFAKGHHGYAYYNTKVGTRHPGLDFDLMKAQIEACHKHGIAVWVYLSIAIDEIYGSTQEGQKDNPGQHFIRVSAETNTHYVRDYTWPMIVECVRDYDIDGFFFDFPGNEAFVQETIKLIRSVKPGIAIAYNHQWDKSREELAKLDILEIESWMHKQTLYHWQYVSRYARGAVPMTAMTTRFWTGWGDFGGIADEAMMRYDAATGLANGCAITIGDQLHPYGRLDPAVYDRIGQVMRDVKEIEPLVFGSESIPYVALLKQSEPTCAALIDSGIHFNVVDESQDLTPFKVLVIPDASKISAEYTDKVAYYVRNGGKLLVTGTPTADMAGLLGIAIDIAVEPEPAFIRIDVDTLPTPPNTIVYSYDNMIAVRPADGTSTLAPLVWALNHGTPHHVSHRHSPPMDIDSGYAAITKRTLGKGEAVYSAAPLFDTYGSMGYTVMKEIAHDIIDTLIPQRERLADVEATAPLEISLNRQGSRVIVHLVNCPVSRRTTSSFTRDDYINTNPLIDGYPTISGTTVSMPVDILRGKSVRIAPDGPALTPMETGNGVMTFTVPDFSISSVIVIE